MSCERCGTDLTNLNFCVDCRAHMTLEAENVALKQQVAELTAKLPPQAPDRAAIEVAVRAALEPQPIRIDSNGRVVAPGLMRVKVEDRPGMPQFGVVLGMLLDERGDMQAVVRLDHYGMMLKAVHPSKVTPVTREEEELHKP